MKKIWILVALIAVAIAVLYPKKYGGPLCGPVCPPSGLSAEKQQCAGFTFRNNYIDGFTDLCIGLPYGAKRCYGTPHGSPPNTWDIELPCDYPPYTQPSLMNPGDEVTISGIVTENDNMSCARDLACLLRVQTERGEILVYYVLPEGNTCVNTAPINAAMKLEKGEAVEVFGKAISDSQIDVCKSINYYIRKTENDAGIIIDSDGLTCVTQPGKAIYPGKEKCCGDLTGIFGSQLPDGRCWCTGKNDICAGAPTCAPCGNGVCEPIYHEDACNCPVDCK